MDNVNLEELFYEAITLAHGEGEAFGASRHKGVQCPECARRDENKMIQEHGRKGPWPKLKQHVLPMVGFNVADRRELAKDFARRARQDGQPT